LNGVIKVVGKDYISTQFQPNDKQDEISQIVWKDCISTNLKPETNLLDMSFEELKPLVYKSTLPINYAKDNANGSYVGNDCMLAGFQLTYGIPMDTNCAPILAALFLCSYVADFINFFRKTNRR